MLAVEDALDFVTVALHRVDVRKLAIHNFLRLFPILVNRLELLLKVCDRALLMVHYFLDLPAVAKKGVQPDLPDLEEIALLFGFAGPGSSVYPSRDQRIDRRQLLAVLDCERT